MADVTVPSHDIIAFLLALPQFPFAQLRGEDDQLILLYENRPIAAITVEPSPRPLPAAAIDTLNRIIHRGLFHGGLDERPPGEGVNAAHQLVELWDALSFAIARAG